MTTKEQIAQVSAEAAALVVKTAHEYGIEQAAAQLARCVIQAMADAVEVTPAAIEAAILKTPQGTAAKTFATIAAGIIAAIQ